MATIHPLALPSAEEIDFWLDVECYPSDMGAVKELATSYQQDISKRFPDTDQISNEDFNGVTDQWLPTVVELECKEQIRADRVLGIAAHCFDGNWVVASLGLIFYSQDIPSGPSGRSWLFAYLVWRYEVVKGNRRAVQGLSDGVGNVRL
ncbi:hypothetical protein GGR55DRAFT_640362 [Xylaria sp. FL0064]|nr:hypothetical protein GGR55DRAFT_640362 [Xylaria sp. FL0064]